MTVYIVRVDGNFEGVFESSSKALLDVERRFQIRERHTGEHIGEDWIVLVTVTGLRITIDPYRVQ